MKSTMIMVLFILLLVSSIGFIWLDFRNQVVVTGRANYKKGYEVGQVNGGECARNVIIKLCDQNNNLIRKNDMLEKLCYASVGVNIRLIRINRAWGNFFKDSIDDMGMGIISNKVSSVSSVSSVSDIP